MKVFDLVPIDGRKSFYGKAKVTLYHDSNRYCIYECYSYNTLVCSYNSDTRQFTRNWYGYSATSMRHINAFMRYLGFDLGGKSWWTSLPVNSPVKLVSE